MYNIDAVFRTKIKTSKEHVDHELFKQLPRRSYSLAVKEGVGITSFVVGCERKYLMAHGALVPQTIFGEHVSPGKYKLKL